MTTGERMKQRRKELGLSAEDIAAKLGISPATIYRYENGGIEKMPGNILAPIAHALKTTPAFLMGWPDPAPVPEIELTKEELQLVTDYRDAEDNIKSAAAVMLHDSAVRNRKDGDIPSRTG